MAQLRKRSLVAKNNHKNAQPNLKKCAAQSHGAPWVCQSVIELDTYARRVFPRRHSGFLKTDLDSAQLTLSAVESIEASRFPFGCKRYF